MRNAYIVTGKLTDDHTVILDEPLPLTPMRVRLIVETLETNYKRSHIKVMQDIRRRQQDRGYRPSTKEEIDAYLSAERGSWGE